MWKYNNEIVSEIPEGMTGFVYLITNLSNNKKYIGKKTLFFKKTRQVKLKKKKYLAESDWKDYYGSNQNLLTDIETCGKDICKREILRFCQSKGEMSYWEAWYQFNYHVLLDDMFYNEWISCKIHKRHLTKMKNTI